MLLEYCIDNAIRKQVDRWRTIKPKNLYRQLIQCTKRAFLCSMTFWIMTFSCSITLNILVNKTNEDMAIYFELETRTLYYGLYYSVLFQEHS